MKKLIASVLLAIFVFALSGCGKAETQKIKITIPAGSTEAFICSDEAVATTGDKIIIRAGEGLGDTEVLLFPVDETITAGYVATYLTHGVPVEFDADKGVWFKIGVAVKNETDTDKTVYVEVEGVEVRAG